MLKGKQQAGTILHSIPVPHTLGLGSPRNQPQGSWDGKEATLGRAGGAGVMLALQQLPSPSGPQFPNQGTGDEKRMRKIGCPGPSCSNRLGAFGSSVPWKGSYQVEIKATNSSYSPRPG